MRYLFLLTITPVQDFISQARKLKDLFGGSHTLSEMSRVGLEYASTYGGVVIFPQKGDGKNSYPNRFLVDISFESEEKLKEFASAVSSEILNYFKNLNKRSSTIIEKHIEDFFQIYWSASEYKNDYKNDYKKAFDEVEKRLAGAKNSRFFEQLGEVGRKCSICGERNVAVYKKPMRFYIAEQRKNLLEARKEDTFQKGEGLCGVCYTKRVSTKSRFESISDITIMNIPIEIREKYNYLHNDSQLFYEENLTQRYFDKNGIDYDLKLCKEEFKLFKQDIRELKQSSYYAIVMFDGDSMGEWLSGKFIKDNNQLEAFHKEISRYLAEFTTVARDILKAPRGETIYAGGEDFLGFVNLSNTFEVLKELNQKFKESISDKITQKQDNKIFTFSAGVVIAHYKTPLGDVLNEVRKSEKKAKQNSDKDSVCLTVLKRSGERRETVLKFDSFFELEYITEQLKKNFSDNFISVLDREFLLMCDESGELDNYLNSMLYAELERTLKRALKSDSSKSNIEPMIESIREIHTVNFRNFIDGLYICRFIDKEIG